MKKGQNGEHFEGFLMLVERCFDTGEVVLNYAEGPDNGPPFLFIHGVTGLSKILHLFYSYLSPSWHLYAPDLRGHGQSSRSTDYSAKANVDDLVKLIDDEIKEPPVIFGHSYGGIIGTMIAGTYPEKVRALIIGDIPGNNNHSMRDFFKTTKDTWSDVRSQIRRGEYSRDWSFRYKFTDPEVLTSWVESGENDEAYMAFLDGYDTGLLFSKISCPVLLVRADPEVGSLMSDADVEHAEELIQDYSFILMSGADHDFVIEAEKTYTAILPFLLSLT